MSYLPVQRLRLYRNFKALAANDFYGIVRYYEQQEEGIRHLDFDEYFDCTYAYTNALFETADHGRHVVMCDHVLELIIMENIETWGGQDVYTHTLFRKACSQFELQDTRQAGHTLRELIKIDPDNKIYQRQWRLCLQSEKPQWLMKTRAASVGVLLFSAVFIAFEFFVIAPFFPTFLQYAIWTHNTLLATGVGILAAGEFGHAWICYSTVYRFVRQRKDFLI
jgi:hypothetical protein